MEEINNFQQEPDETFFQACERFKKLLMKYPQHYLTKMQEVILFYNGLDVPTRQILDSRGVVPTMTAADAKKAIQEMAKYSQKWHNGTSRGKSTETSDRLAAIQAQLNNLGREIKKVNEKVCAAQVGLELADKTVKYPKGIAENVLVEIGKFTFLVDFIILDMPKDIKVPLILRRPFLFTARVKINVYKRKITLESGKLSENQVDDLMPTIEEGEVIEEFRTRDEDLDTEIDDYPSYCDVLHDLEDMDAYRNEGMGDIIVGEPFLREVGIKTKRLEGIITLYNGDNEWRGAWWCGDDGDDDGDKGGVEMVVMGCGLWWWYVVEMMISGCSWWYGVDGDDVAGGDDVVFGGSHGETAAEMNNMRGGVDRVDSE
ncbi:putative reverse transcriptase domain-containing protein [Tanacetum coccineum]